MDVNLRDAEVIFRKLDVELVRSTHHVRGFVILDGRRVLPIHYSFGRGSFPGHIGDKFRRSLRLTPTEFRNMVACRLSKAAYEGLLRERL